MCGRFTVTVDAPTLKKRLSVVEPLTLESYNLAPSQNAPVVMADGNQRIMQMQRFGFIPFYAKSAKEGFRSINARIETVNEKPAFRNAMKDHRCVIPASGFYEWADGKVKQPYYFTPPDGELLMFGGIWSKKQFDGEDIYSFAILTTAPHPVVSDVHDRSPLMLSADAVERWLDPLPIINGDLNGIIGEAAKLPLTSWPVDRRVGSPRNNDPALIVPIVISPPSKVPEEARED